MIIEISFYYYRKDRLGPTAVSSHTGTYGGLQTTGQAPGDARGQEDHQELQQTGQGPSGI